VFSISGDQGVRIRPFLNPSLEIFMNKTFPSLHYLLGVAFACLCCLALVACGGGGGGDSGAASGASGAGQSTGTGIGGGSTSGGTDGGQPTTSASVSVAELNFVQVLNRKGTDASLRLTPNRPVLVRAFVSASAPGVSSPLVTLAVTNGSTAVGSLTMSGPAVLPTAADVNSLSTTFNAIVPAAWVTPGVSFKAVAAPAPGTSTSASATSAPTVGNAAKLHLVLVPLIVNGVAPKLPSLALAHDIFSRVYPMASDDIVVTARAPYAVADVTWIATDSDESTMLSQLEALRQQEDPEAVYYGMFPAAQANSTLGGVGYVNPVGRETTGGMSSVGYDGDYAFFTPDSLHLNLPAWAQVAIHEVGHNHSLKHAPCGAALTVDANYPYAGGVLNPTMPVYDSLYNDDTSIGALGTTKPSEGAMTDAMGYCSGIYFSDYHYNKVQAFAEIRTAAYQPKAQSMAASRALDSNGNGFIVFSGTITSEGAKLNPAHATSRSSAAATADTPFTLRVTTAAGQILSYPLMASELADSQEPVFHFAMSIPNPGAVSKVEVLKGGVALASEAGRAKALSADKGEASPRPASWAETNGVLLLTWNAQAEPFATVVHVANDGKRTVVAMRLQGGAASISTGALPAGGSFEISFSSTANARLVTLQR
jgi:hypothetical protein